MRIDETQYKALVKTRHRVAAVWRGFYFASLIVALVILLVLLFNIINQSFGLIIQTYPVKVADISERPLEDLNAEELSGILLEQLPRQLLVLTRINLATVPESQFTTLPVNEALAGNTLPEGLEGKKITELSREEQAQLLALNLTPERLREIIHTEILFPEVEESFLLIESLFERGKIETVLAEKYPEGELLWRSWLNPRFVTSQLDPEPADAGIRPALLGTIYLLIITITVAFPIGVGAAIYLEEYAQDTWLNRLIEINIRNLAGVPSIIYGMLGLAIFVRAMETITNGRTVLSAGLTMALLILPLIIINAQEALRAVPFTLREASYGLGATKWQTISRQILPAATPGIMTGTILAMSRAIGETAPLIVVGAATYITVDPDGPFAKFTALPILIYSWTSQPNPQYRNIAAAAIIILLILLLTMNSAAIIIRNRAAKRRM